MWYVIGSLSRQNELKIRDALRAEGRECFVPLRYEISQSRGKVQRRVRRLVPAVAGLVFLKGELEELKEFLYYRKERVFLRKSTYSNREEYLKVSDHDMENFIAVTEKAGEHITYFDPSEIQLRPGDRIRVNGGMFDGREGVIMRVKGKRRKQLVVSIPGILIASVEMEPDLVEVIEEKGTMGPVPNVPERSKNVEEDRKALFRLAKRLLLEIPSSYQHEKEYFLLMSELKRTAGRLSSVKGFIPSQEVELALPLYLAAVKLQQDIPVAEARLRQGLSKLQDSSLLKLKAQMYLSVLSSDEALRGEVEERVASLRSQKLSLKQKALIEEFELLSKAAPCNP